MAKFLKSASSIENWYNDHVTEFCFVGRSNVGKSSLINAMARQNIAKTSKTPGRTQLVNFYDFGNFRLVDLPGYGYANTGRTLQKDITKIIDEYLVKRTNLYAVFQIVDANVITDLDADMSRYFNKRFANHFIILNKIDKNNISKYQNTMIKISKLLDVKPANILLVSAKKLKNIEKISKIMQSLLKKVK